MTFTPDVCLLSDVFVLPTAGDVVGLHFGEAPGGGQDWL